MQEKRGSVEGDKKHENLASETSKSASGFLSALDFPVLTIGESGRRRTAPPEPGAAGAYRDENVEPLNFDDYGDFKADLC